LGFCYPVVLYMYRPRLGGWDSVVCIVICNVLDGWSLKQWSKFSVPVQTGPGAHSAGCMGGSGCLFLEVKQLGHGINHPPNPELRLKKEFNDSPAPLLGLHGLLWGELYL
jgi:hypothetical protein